MAVGPTLKTSKLYKSKVCFTKHLWEHTVYWDQFAGEKNHDRVLSIQAALILYSGNHGYTEEDANMLSFLLVTSPHNEKKQKDYNGNEAKLHNRNERKQSSPLKRKRPSSETDDEDSQ
ncbi:uncharacterized protein LOC106181637 isoform X2 [Lingula anatina]|uniref:Uncharacterized protein LOC106181637 isoform X2 n=1 Tax=Lingula anatina TaxID=7574 RepID=A0A1S3KGC6_LINAN|nr:uncharacterized protein LOC106181637 isoform X2 [Lingula anatina]|eukprot:XP_013421542.1 uncharacterized protein LOC106181637 isoform X2 [Lingula anatina]